MDDKPKGVPPVTPKSVKRESLAFGQPASFNGNEMSRYSGNYSKKQPVVSNDTDLFEGF